MPVSLLSSFLSIQSCTKAASFCNCNVGIKNLSIPVIAIINKYNKVLFCYSNQNVLWSHSCCQIVGGFSIVYPQYWIHWISVNYLLLIFFQY